MEHLVHPHGWGAWRDLGATDERGDKLEPPGVASMEEDSISFDTDDTELLLCFVYHDLRGVEVPDTGGVDTGEFPTVDTALSDSEPWLGFLP